MKVQIGKDFSKDPGGRFYTDGSGSGEEFREEFLLPRLKQLKEKEKLVMVLDDEVEGYGSSFLVEGFAGIVKYGYMNSDKLLGLIEFEYSDPDYEFYKEKILQYVAEAKFKSKTYVPTK